MATEIKINVSEEAAKILERPMHLKTMGNLAYGGKVTHKPDGETYHGDHGYAEYFVPENAYNYPVICWHGQGESGAYFQSTPDGREGLCQIMLRLNWAVCLIDQNRRGRASYTDVVQEPTRYANLEHESAVWTTFRNGTWAPPEPAVIFEGSQFPLSPYAVDQFFRQQCFEVGDTLGLEFNMFLAGQMKQLLEQMGPSILFTHSASGKHTFATGTIASDMIKGIVAYEPGGVLFPDDYDIPDIYSPLKEYNINEIMSMPKVPKEQWLNLTKFPIRIYFGDFMPDMDAASEVYGDEIWRFSKARTQQFVDLINENGGDAKLIFLPELGIKGNTHDAFSDLNNLEFFNVLHKDMVAAGLAVSDHPYQGPDRKPLAEYTVPNKF